MPVNVVQTAIVMRDVTIHLICVDQITHRKLAAVSNAMSAVAANL